MKNTVNHHLIELKLSTTKSSIDMYQKFIILEVYILYWGAWNVLRVKSIFRTTLAWEKWRVTLSKQYRACTTPSLASSLCSNLAEFAIRLCNWMLFLGLSGLRSRWILSLIIHELRRSRPTTNETFIRVFFWKLFVLLITRNCLIIVLSALERSELS